MMVEQKAERFTYPRKGRNDTTVVNPFEDFSWCLTLSLCIVNEIYWSWVLGLDLPA